MRIRDNSAPRSLGIRRRRRKLASAAAWMAVVLLGATACDEIIQVEAADRVDEGTLAEASQALLLANSAQATFECAYSGYVHSMGLFADELNSLGNTGIYSYDRRDPVPAGGFVGVYADGDCFSPGLYKPLSSARWFADDVLNKLQGWTDAQVPNRQALIARSAAYGGYSLLLLGESMCSAAIDEGPELSQADLLALAEDRFDVAISEAGGAGADDVLNLARVGRARARLNQGNTQGAVDDASVVPAGFVFDATYEGGTTSNLQRRNDIYSSINFGQGTGLAPQTFVVTSADAAGNPTSAGQLEWMGVPDPRMGIIDLGLTTLGVIRVQQTKYTTVDSPIRLASWAEAQLILGEIEGGQTEVDAINAMHTAAGIPAFDATGLTPAQVRNHLIQERQRELFLEGHRAYDRARLQVPLDPPAGSPYRWGGIHGAAICFPLPNIERDNNPNID